MKNLFKKLFSLMLLGLPIVGCGGGESTSNGALSTQLTQRGSFVASSSEVQNITVQCFSKSSRSISDRLDDSAGNVNPPVDIEDSPNLPPPVSGTNPAPVSSPSSDVVFIFIPGHFVVKVNGKNVLEGSWAEIDDHQIEINVTGIKVALNVSINNDHISLSLVKGEINKSCSIENGLSLKEKLLSKTFKIDANCDLANYHWYSCPIPLDGRPSDCREEDLPKSDSISFDEDNVIIRLSKNGDPKVGTWVAIDSKTIVTMMGGNKTFWEVSLLGDTVKLNLTGPSKPQPANHAEANLLN